jgi:predicted DNA-binding transcriptional regulator YafY
MTDAELPKLGLTNLQLAALHLARTELDHLAGSSLVQEIDRLLAELRPPESQASFSFARTSGGPSKILTVIDRALAGKRRLRITYRSRARGGESEVVHVDPLLLRVADRTPYLHGYCVERAATRTYKLSRVESAEITAETIARPIPGEDPFDHSRKAWTGEAQVIRIRLAPHVAHLAPEYPLVRGQKTLTQTDGSLIVEARVAGHVEALPWILGWGAAAQVLEPAELKAVVVEQLTDALARYGSPRVTRPQAKKIPGHASALAASLENDPRSTFTLVDVRRLTESVLSPGARMALVEERAGRIAGRSAPNHCSLRYPRAFRSSISMRSASYTRVLTEPPLRHLDQAPPACRWRGAAWKMARRGPPCSRFLQI